MISGHYSKKPWGEAPKRQPIFTPDPSWTLDKIRSTTTEHETGYFYRSSRLASWMMRDGRLATTMETRVKGLLGLPFSIEPPDDPPTRNETRVTRALAELWPQIMPEKVSAEVLEGLVLYGFCLCQVTWTDQPRAAARWVPRLRVWDPAACYYDSFRQTWVISHMSGQEDITPGDGRWVLFSFRDTQPWMAGLVRQLPIPVLIRSFSWSDWSNFNETLGQSFLKGTVPSWAEKDTEDESGTPSKDLFLEQIQGLGRDNRYILCEEGSDGTKYDATYESPDGEGSASFEKAQSSASMEVTTRVLGQNLTTEVKGGSYAATKEHGEVRQDYKEADAECLSSDAREQLLKLFTYYNFGDPEIAPWAYFDPTPPSDKKLDADTLKSLSESIDKLQAAAKGTGKQVDVEALYERFGVPLKDGERESPEPVVVPASDKDPDARMLRNIVPWRRRQSRPQSHQGRPYHPQEAV